MTFVDDDQVEEIWSIFSIESWTPFVSCDRLIDRKVHFPALDRLPLDLPTSIAKGCKIFVLRIIDENISVSQKENSRLSRGIAFRIPPGRPEFPTDLEGYRGLSCASGKRQEIPSLPRQNGFDGPVYRNSLVVPGNLLRVVEVRNQSGINKIRRKSLSGLIAIPEFIRGGKGFDLLFLLCELVVLDD